MKISWDAPFENYRPILGYGYQVLIGTNAGTFVEKKTLCDGLAQEATRYCLVDMHELRKAPFNLVYGDLIQAKVLAANERGWSDASPANTAGARVEVEPSAVVAPARGVLTGPTQLDVYWTALSLYDAGGSPVLSYHLQYDNHTAATTWLDVVGLAPDSLLLTVIVSTNVESGSMYGFRVRARNVFGWGPYSQVTYIQAAREPDQPQAPVTSIDTLTGGVVITWVAPSARGDPITAYTIEIANKAQDAWSTVPTCDGTDPTVRDALRCVVPMTTFTGPTFGYLFNDVVYVRVKATNSYGYGVLSQPCDDSGARIRSVPIKMNAPVESLLSTDTQILLSWTPLTGVDAGNSDIIAYSLYWDEGDSQKTEADVPLYDANVDQFTVMGVTGGVTYRFRVRARNIYGNGPFSDDTIVVPDDAPGKTAIPTVQLAVSPTTSVQISWDLPNEHSATITKYDIYFEKSNGDFAMELTACDGTDATIVSERKCTVPMNIIRDLTLLPRDSLIRVKVRAYNARGIGQFSELNTEGATIETVSYTHLTLPTNREV